MHVVITPDAVACPEAYPEWCGLGWFQNFRHLTCSVELHYHDLPEVYLWHEGRAEAMIDGQPVPMRYGVVAYTAAGAQHSYAPAGTHSNTGIMPKAYPGCRNGHLHIQTTGESPKPEAPSFSLTPEENSCATPVELPRHCFARHMACGRFTDAQVILKRAPEGWLGLLVREGKIHVWSEGQVIEVPENHLFIASPQCELRAWSVDRSEVALAEGWPVEPAHQQESAL